MHSIFSDNPENQHTLLERPFRQSILGNAETASLLMSLQAV